MIGNNPVPEDRIPPTSDNQYFVGKMSTSKSYTPEEAGAWLGKSGRWIRQKAHDIHVGQKHKKLWTFTAEDLTILYTHIRRRRKPVEEQSVMRDVSPRSAEEAAHVQASIEDVKAFLRSNLEKLKGEFFDLAHELFNGAHNELVKEQTRHEKLIQRDWQEMMELKARLRKVEDVLKVLESKMLAGGGAVQFGDRQPLYPMDTDQLPLREVA